MTTTFLKAAFADVEEELSITRRVLERVPEKHFGWKPHPRSWSLVELASHVANLPVWMKITLESNELNLDGPMQGPGLPTTNAELLARFDESVRQLRDAFSAADDEALSQPWTLRAGDQVIWTQPRSAVLRGGGGISHLIHHRGQLTVYLRLLDTPVPPVYGPSADEGRGF